MKINLLIDGSYLLHKDIFILHKLKTIYQDLGKLLSNDIEKITKMFPFTNIYFVSDRGASWRKDIYEQYKANRDKTSDIDWQAVYKIYDEFKEKLKTKKNVKIIEIPSLEGDDVIAYIVNKSNKLNYSNVIVSNDGDIHQLLRFDMTNNYINVQWNYRFNDERFYVPKNFNMFSQKILMSESNDIFSLDNSSEFGLFLEVITARTKVKEVIGEEILFCKLLTGDTSDNIETVIKIKNRGIGDSGAAKCYQMYKDAYPDVIDFDSDEFKTRLVDIVSYYKKTNDYREEIYKNIGMNLKLIKLDSALLPENLLHKMEDVLVEYNEYEDFWD